MNPSHDMPPSTITLCDIHKLISKHGLPMKPLRIEADDSSCTVYFFSENRVDFRNLVKDINALFGRPVRLHQVNPRDEAKMVGGIGSCGKTLCCRSFLSGYEPLPLECLKKQAQNSTQSLGVCGKLQCCLLFDGEMRLKIREEKQPDIFLKENAKTLPPVTPPIDTVPAAETKPEVPSAPQATQDLPVNTEPQQAKHLIRRLTLKKQKHS